MLPLRCVEGRGFSPCRGSPGRWQGRGVHGTGALHPPGTRLPRVGLGEAGHLGDPREGGGQGKRGVQRRCTPRSFHQVRARGPDGPGASGDYSGPDPLIAPPAGRASLAMRRKMRAARAFPSPSARLAARRRYVTLSRPSSMIDPPMWLAPPRGLPGGHPLAPITVSGAGRFPERSPRVPLSVTGGVPSPGPGQW